MLFQTVISYAADQAPLRMPRNSKKSLGILFTRSQTTDHYKNLINTNAKKEMWALPAHISQAHQSTLLFTRRRFHHHLFLHIRTCATPSNCLAVQQQLIQAYRSEMGCLGTQLDSFSVSANTRDTAPCPSTRYKLKPLSWPDVTPIQDLIASPTKALFDSWNNRDD